MRIWVVDHSRTLVTITHNNSTAEMLATIQRGPFAKPTDEEYIEYLIQRRPKTQRRPDFEHYSLEHVLSFQRRVQAIKKNFMQRNNKTPLGRLAEWWDRILVLLIRLKSRYFVWPGPNRKPENNF